MQVTVQDDVQVYVPVDGTDRDARFEEICRDNPTLRVEQKSTGEIVVMAPEGFESSDRNGEIIHQLKTWAKRDGRGRAVGASTVFVLPDGSKLGPDAAWISREKILAIPRAARRRFLSVAPDFVIELRSPADRLNALEAKMQDWTRNGVQLAWSIDADAKIVWIYAAGRKPERLDAPEKVLGSGPVLGFELMMGEIYRGLDF